MNDQQILSIALTTVPTMITVLIGILINNSRIGDLNDRIGELRTDINDRFKQVDRSFEQVDRRFEQVDRRFQQIDLRFEETKDLWRSELHRVEGILDARLKHFEQR
jgi:hypothetical protein